MRVAQIIDGLYIGGAEKLLVTFSGHARSVGMDVTIIPLRIYPETPFLKQLQQIPVPVHEFRGRNLIDPLRFLRLLNFLRRERFDVVHLHLTYSILLGALAAKLAGVPVIASIHNTRPDRWAGLEAFALKHWVDSVLAVGHEVEKAYQPKLSPKRIKIILNAVNEPVQVDEEHRLRLRRELGLQPGQILALAVGRLVEQKGYADLLQAAAILKASELPVKIAIAGIGDLQDDLAAQIDALKVNGTVRLLGSRHDVPFLMAASDLFVNSSHWEGLPVAVLEAMAAGLPVVATAVGDIPGIINVSNGVLVPPRDPAALAGAIQSVAADEKLRHDLGRRARAYVMEHHAPGVWVRQLYAEYESVIHLHQKGV